MPNCAIVGCKNHSRKTAGRNIKYYRFPRNEDILMKWIQACRRVNKLNLNNARICSTHFAPNSFENSIRNRLMNYAPTNYRALKEDAVPTENLPSSNFDVIKARNGGGINELTDTNSIIINFFNQPKPKNYFMPSDRVPNIKVQVERIDQEPSVNMNKYLQETRALKTRIKQLEEEVESLKTQKNALVKSNKETLNLRLAAVNSNLRKHFTPGQIKRLLNPTKIYRSWTPEDIAMAVSLRKVSLKAYRYLRLAGYPLPALSTLKKWAEQTKEVPVEFDMGIIVSGR